MLRIALLTHYMPPHQGGIERVAEALFDGYRAAGAEVRWLASRAPADAPRVEDGRRRVRCWNGLERRLGVPVPVWGPEGWRAAARAIAWSTVIHVHDCLYPGSLAAALLGPRRGRPLLLTQHVGLVSYRAALLNAVQRATYRTVGRRVLLRADLLVAATPAAERWIDLLVAGRAAPPRRRIDNGIDLSSFRPPSAAERAAARRQFGLDESAPVALFVGRLVEKKGVPLLAGIARRRPGIRFLVVGDGPLRPLLAASSNIQRVPELSPAGMPAAYHAADCLLLPSQGEGLPLVVQEAMACGLAVVVSRGEAFADELSAAGLCLAAERSEPAMEDALDRALATAPGLGGRARTHAETHWSRSDMVKRYLALLDRLAAAPRGTRR